MVGTERKILIIDDSPEDRELYRRYLLRDGDYSYKFLEASQGKQGIKLFQQHQPDAILLDYRLPDLDGLELLSQLKSLLAQPYLPAIMVTGQGNEAIAVQAMKAGAQDYLVKEQITPEGLQLAVQGAIENVELRNQLQQRIERERVVSQITQKIYQSSDLSEILQTTVTEVRQFLQTDRVLIFRLQSNGWGIVKTESVGAEWTPLLSTSLYDPCLNENYIEYFCQGFIKVKSDIYDGSIDACHVELLAKLQVRANLVVPILQDGQLWGMLIAHHCRDTRQWQPLEIELLQELATGLGIALRQAELYQQAQYELSERRQVEAELRENEQRLQMALQASRMGTWDWNIQTGVISWSDNLEALFGLQPGEFDGSLEMFKQLLHPEDSDRVQAAIDRAITTGEDYKIEFRVVYPHGKIRWALSQGKVFYDQNNQPIRMAGSDIDITETKKSAEALRESELRFRQIAENIDAVFWIKDVAENRVSYVSPAYERLWDLNCQDLYADQNNWFNFIHPEDRESINRAFQEKAIADQFDEEYRIILPDGSIRWVRDRCFGIKDETGNTYRFTGIAEDITARKQRELNKQFLTQLDLRLRHLQDAQTMMQETVRSLGQYLDVNRCTLGRVNLQQGLYIPEQVWSRNFDHLAQTQKLSDFATAELQATFASNQAVVVNEITTDPRTVTVAQNYRLLQISAFVAIPCIDQGKLAAVLTVSTPTSRVWSVNEVTLLQEAVVRIWSLIEQTKVTQALRESEERFRTSVENILDCLGIYSAIRNEQGQIIDFRTEYVNHAACVNNQLTYEQQIGRGLCELLPGHRESGLFDEYCQVVETGKSLVKENLIYTDEYGQQRLTKAFDIRVAKFGDGFVATWRDITNRKQTEDALRNNEQLLRLALAGAQAGSWDWDIQTGKVFWSWENFALHGIEPVNHPLEYEDWCQGLHPDDLEQAKTDVSQVVEQRQLEYRSEFRIVHPQRGIRWLLALGRLIINEQGEPMRLSGINLDITERKQAEKSLQESEERFRNLADNMSQFAWMADEHGNIFWYNQRWFDYTGTTLEEMQGWGWQKVHHPDHFDRVVRHIRHCFETGQSWEDTFPLRGHDGQYRWFLSRAIPIYDHQGKILRWFGTNTDITEQKQAEQERNRLLEQEQIARAEAERANRIKDEFLAILSHELRSPLNPILGWAKLMQSRKFDPAKTAEALATIERNANLQCQLIDDLLDVAKILRGKLNMDVASVNLVFVIEAALDTVKTAAFAKSIVLNSVLAQVGQVSGDSARLQQILWNLLSNAIKFTPPGGRVDIILQRVDNQAQIQISDTGKGINPDFLPHIFESFRQEDASTTRKYGGLGLGLAIVRYLVEAHGGTIQADSQGEGQGATFTVKLPLLDDELLKNHPDELLAQEIDLTGVKVLVVDDEIDARELVIAVLEQYGAEVLAVTSAAEVLASLEWFQPQVLISDIGMPEMDGYTLLQRIRSLPDAQGGQIGAIALSAYARMEDQQRSLAAGFQHHICKPLDLDKLVQTVFELAQQN
ncbi:PAS domain-containing protein [Nostoc sp. FACHB-110]|uniref:PAS domain-containing protein n=1 Tax=Nostoc sp. FACHB-110 TaxID=2692834 RepID=UPI001682699D|nr:PAS domain-containing protein [Nostoc sp. FACHB-110]MBD2437759.1 PAS domain-containing protein [Nostoc sp. FACHB-110]